MKLKLVVASMSVLGLISCDAFAATQTQYKHHHHRHHHKAAMVETTVVKHDYKDLGALPVEVCPRVDMYDAMLDNMSHNVGRAKPTVHCMDPLSFAGGIAFDANWGNRHIGYSGENEGRFALNDAYLNAFGNVSEWTQAFASVSYSGFEPALATLPPRTSTDFGVNRLGAPQSGVYSNSYRSETLTLEQGFITFKNLDVTPIFVRVGKMFEDFGRYELHPMTESFTQVMSESLHTTAQLGFMTRMGLNGSVYTFNNTMYRFNPVTGSGTSHTQNNWGAALDFAQPNDQLGYDIGAGYLYDFTGIDQVAYAVNQFNNTATNNSGYNGTYRTRVSAATLHGELNTGPFSLAIRYVTALQSFNNNDLATKTITALAGTAGSGASPWSADITGGYGFNGWNRDQNVYLGYQATGNAVNLFLPRSRWLAGYGVNVWRSTNVGVQVNHDLAYSTSTGGTGNSSNTITLRAAVQFG